MDTPEACFEAMIRSAPSAPLVTFYDRASGERTELSASSLGNWVAKTYWLLIDEYGPRSRIFLDLPLHWSWYVAALGAWSAGQSIGSDAGTSQAAVLGGRALDDPPVGPDLYALSLAPWARPFEGDPPAGATDFVLAVRPQADAWAGVRFPSGEQDPALDELPRAELVRLARDRAAELGLTAGGRLLVGDRGLGAATDTATVLTLLAPIAVGASVVLVRNAPVDPAELDQIAASEGVTARC